MRRILEGVRILDFTQMKAGPMGTQFLGDLGADVIKVERVGSGDWERSFPAFGTFTESGTSAFFLALNRNKRSIALNLKDSRAIEILYKLLPTVDVVVQNFRPGVMENLGLGYRNLKAIKPDIIYCSNSGYGQSGPYKDRPGQDLLAQAVSGMILTNGRTDSPTIVATTVADGVAAFLVGTAILGALVHRLRTGEGQEVEVDLLSSLISLQQEEISALLNLVPEPAFERSAEGVAAPWLAAPYGIYATSDDKLLALAMNPLELLASLLEIPDLANYSDPESAFQNRDSVVSMIKLRIRERPLEHWLEVLLAADIWCAPVNDLKAMTRDPQVVHNNLFVESFHPVWGTFFTVANPIRYTQTPATYERPVPAVGEHTREVLHDVGISDEELSVLASQGVLTLHDAI